QPPHIRRLNEKATTELTPHTEIHVHAVRVAQPLIDVGQEGLDPRSLLGKASLGSRADQLGGYIEGACESWRGDRGESSRGVVDCRGQSERGAIAQNGHQGLA